MARIPDGINGPFIGRIGNRVYYMLNGQNVSREIGVCGPHNDNQKAISTKMKLIAPFVATVSEFVKAGFKNTRKSKANQTAISYAHSVNMKNAVVGKYPNQMIDYSKTIFSEGEIAPPENPAVTQKGNNLEIRWEADLAGMNADEHDQIMVMVYLPDEVKRITVMTGAKRTEELQLVPVPTLGQETEMFIHVAFVNADRTDVSDSTFVKQLIWKPMTI